MHWPAVRRHCVVGICVASIVVTGSSQVAAQPQQSQQQVTLPQQLLSPQQPFGVSDDRQARLLWLVNVLRELERDGTLQRLVQKEAHEADVAIPDSLLHSITSGLQQTPQAASAHESMDAYGYNYGGGYGGYKSDYGDDDSSDDDSSDDDSSDDDSSDDYKRHRYHKKHKHKKKCKCKKKKKKKGDKESNVFSKIRGVNIGTTFANIQITGGNATSPEAPSAAMTTNTQTPGSVANVVPGLNTGWGGVGWPGGIGPGGVGSGVLPPVAGTAGVAPAVSTTAVPATAGSARGALPGGLTGTIAAGTPATMTAVPPATETPTPSTETPTPSTEAPTQAPTEAPTVSPASSETPTAAPMATAVAGDDPSPTPSPTITSPPPSEVRARIGVRGAHLRA